ncbi:MAG: hypothetical protein AABZ53_06880 [Planctomycetota bacterium]
MGIDLLTERARRVAAVAQRLRLVQAELVDHPAEERRGHLRDEVEHVLRAMVPTERKQFLFDILDAFPVLGESAAPEAGQGAGPDRATLDALAAAQAEVSTLRTELSRFNDTGFVSDRLIELSKKQNEDQRKTLVKKLSAAGLAELRTVSVASASAPQPPIAPAPKPSPQPAPHHAPGQPAVVGGDLRKALALADHENVDGTRAGELCGILVDFSSGLDDLVWTAWREAIARGGKLNRPGPIRRTFGQYVRGDAGSSKAKVAEDLALLRRITAATIAATSRAGKNFARSHLNVFGVEAIKAAVGAGGWGSPAPRYWAKYEELMVQVTADSIDAEIMKTIGDAARGLAEGGAGTRQA